MMAGGFPATADRGPSIFEDHSVTTFYAHRDGLRRPYLATKGRGHKVYKAFLATFVCFSIRAAHQVVSDYSTETFLTAFRRWQALQQMRDHFWQRWSQEYLHTLNARPKWWKKNTNLRIGDLCLIRGETMPPSKWLLARVITVHPGDNGQVWVVTVRTTTSSFKRPPSHQDSSATQSLQYLNWYQRSIR
ncbi:hypothetical protein DMN91_001659 [Ooceraea biroi]|uniref:DUF5641 domain-containing protein n=1 Tax=Ooceraea biroi TaxID=2015173 RepID=A0A3L8DZ55_OOCBI|nr:hypothetical protein DMN91_001659 [Ooceraea biroi]